jgi:hypothetical protein
LRIPPPWLLRKGTTPPVMVRPRMTTLSLRTSKTRSMPAASIVCSKRHRWSLSIARHVAEDMESPGHLAIVHRCSRGSANHQRREPDGLDAFGCFSNAFRGVLGNVFTAGR